MKVLKTSLFLFIVIIITNLAWALFYYNNQMEEFQTAKAVKQLQDITEKCYQGGGSTVLKPSKEGFDGACVYMQIRFGESQIERNLTK